MLSFPDPCSHLRHDDLLGLDRTSPTAPTPSSTTASQAGDDDVEAGNDAGDDSLQDGSNAINDCHEAGSKGLEEGFDLCIISCEQSRRQKNLEVEEVEE